jgi:periplasmic copper chaperone A
MRSRSPEFMAFTALVLIAGLLPGTAAPAPAPLVDVQVKEAWIRWLPANLPAAGYMTLVNGGAKPQVLIGAASPDYAELGFHQTRSNNGMTEMVQVRSITLQPYIPVRFAEGGYHLMLMRPTRPIHPGDVVTITLRFADGRSIAVPFSVRN